MTAKPSGFPGSILPDKSSRASSCFSRAWDTARDQGALFWELRIALSLARLRMRQNRAKDAGFILGPVYDRFTEGHAIPDLRSARALIEACAT